MFLGNKQKMLFSDKTRQYVNSEHMKLLNNER